MKEFEERATKVRKVEPDPQANKEVHMEVAEEPSSSSAAASSSRVEPPPKRDRGDGAGKDVWEELAAKIRRGAGEPRAEGERGHGGMDVEGLECLHLACEEHDVRYEYYDSRTGEPLNGDRVREARDEELKELERRVYIVADVRECFEKTGKPPIGVRWVDVFKGEGVYRSRLVAKDFKTKGRNGDVESLYAAMPPLELVKLVFIEAAATGRKVMLLDIGKAHLYAPVDGEVYVDLPPERQEPGKCAKLLFTLYGMRTAASNWEREYTKTLGDIGFQVGKANACAFWHPDLKVSIVVHGDDFVMAGMEKDLKYVEKVFREKYPVKMRALLGPEPNDHKEAEILNRKVYWTKDGIEFEADPNHVERILEEMGMQDCNASVAPGVQRDDDSEGELNRDEAWMFRSVVARANYLAQDRPDIRYTVKELCRRMSKPNRSDWMALKKLCRYLRGRPRLRQRAVCGGGGPGVLSVYVDSDWAGCRETRRSTNGGVLMVRGMCLKVWSSTQTVVARSSGEAEYYAAVKGASEAMGFQSGCRDLGIELKIQMLTDSSACQGICRRTGIGKVKHMAVQLLWLQDVARRGALVVKYVRGDANPADLMTKFLTRPVIDRHLCALGFRVVDRTAGLYSPTSACDGRRVGGGVSGDSSILRARWADVEDD
jgi:hypothetical protein